VFNGYVFASPAIVCSVGTAALFGNLGEKLATASVPLDLVQAFPKPQWKINRLGRVA
jgi:hypothetical protein